MATKLKNMKLTSVDLVRSGANQEADFCLFKSEDGAEDRETGLFKRFLGLLRDNPEREEPEAPRVREIPMDDGTFLAWSDALAKSIQSIQEDDSLDQVTKADMVQKSFEQFHAAVSEFADAPEAEKTADVSKEEKPMAKKAPDYEVICEIEKFNPYHGRDGRFTSASGGGAVSAGGESKKPAAPANLESDMQAAARKLRQYDKHLYPAEWEKAADEWNALYGQDTELGNKILREHGL